MWRALGCPYPQVNLGNVVEQGPGNDPAQEGAGYLRADSPLSPAVRRRNSSTWGGLWTALGQEMWALGFGGG